jgi:hypothetical protein
VAVDHVVRHDEARRLAQPALGAIASDRIADLAGCGEAEPGRLRPR